MMRSAPLDGPEDFAAGSADAYGPDAHSSPDPSPCARKPLRSIVVSAPAAATTYLISSTAPFDRGPRRPGHSSWKMTGKQPLPFARAEEARRERTRQAAGLRGLG